MMPGQLAGLRVLILRAPRPDDPLVERLIAAGAEVHCLPVLRIEPVAASALAPAEAAAIWIFVSRHAVRHGADALRAAGISRGGRALYGVGMATAAAAQEAFGGVVRWPRQATSEGLLALAELQAVAGREVAIFRGVGGRELLRTELAARGARVSCIEVYRRVTETRWAARIRAQWQRPGPRLAVAHSGAVVQALHRLLEPPSTAGEGPGVWGQGGPCLVPGSRVAEIARDAGFEPVIAEAALAEPMERAICRWYTHSIASQTVLSNQTTFKDA